ncbi:hypothetical protein BH10BAC3_BH10BAC3_33930 [soil metagenome]
MTANKNQSIILVCTGLGRIQRGFEMYIASLAQKLVESNAFTAPLEVWTGGEWRVAGVKSRKIGSIDRNSHWLKKRGDAFIWEQRSFAIGMVPLLLSQKPAAIYLGEYQLYCYLFKIRQFFRLNFSLVLYTGGQAIPGLFNPALDYVHHVTDQYLVECRHIPQGRQFLIPHFIETDFVYEDAVIAMIKKKAAGKRIVLSVGIIDNTIKRMDLLVESLLPIKEQVFPVLLGESSGDEPAIRQQLEAGFGKDGFIIDKVAHQRLGNYYKAADLFVLCSPKESFGLASLEALYHGLTVISDDFAEVKFVLKEEAHFVPMKTKAKLTEAIINLLSTSMFDQCRHDKRQFVTNHYTWPFLRKQYLDMFGEMYIKQT